MEPPPPSLKIPDSDSFIDAQTFNRRNEEKQFWLEGNFELLSIEHSVLCQFTMQQT